MNGRLYDPVLGRMLSPDLHIQAPSLAQNYNRYSYVLNNPLIYTDPDGEIISLVVVAGLLFTDVGYDIQKFLFPVAIHIDLNFGTHGKGIGIDVSVGVPQNMPISYRYEIGASYYFDRVGGYGSGWQVRNGAEWSFGGGAIQYGGMRYRDWNKDGLQVDQVVHTAQIGGPLVQLSYSNDTEDSFPIIRHLPFLPDLPEGGIAQTDRYRTASGYFRFGPLEAGFFLHTGEGEETQLIDTDGDGVGDTWALMGGNVSEAKRSNGIIYFNFLGLNLGWDSEGIRQALQNDLVHDWVNGGNRGSAYPWYLQTQACYGSRTNRTCTQKTRKSRFVFQFGGF